jgi:hypothetical protein
LTGSQTHQTLSANVYVSPQHVETLLDLCEVMAEAIEMVRNDHESTPVSRARALAYCCGVDAKLIEIATISERQQPEQSEDKEITLDAEYNEAQGFLIDTNPDVHGDYLKWFLCEVRLLHNRDAESEAAWQAATSDLISKASKDDGDLVRIYTDALRVQ